jgi:hypothetical protein
MMSKLPIVILLMMVMAGSAHAETLVWNPNSEPDLAGYKVYQRTDLTYGPPVAILGKVTTYTTPILPSGLTYWAVTAYDLAGNESAKSAEVSKVVPPTMEQRLTTAEATIELLSARLGILEQLAAQDAKYLAAIKLEVCKLTTASTLRTALRRALGGC